MNLRQKKFIEEKLIPFILREQGQGFVMDRTLYQDAPGSFVQSDGIEHHLPSCGAAACIYGSVKFLHPRKEIDVEGAAKILGLSYEAANGLFYSWGPNPEPDDRYHWPHKEAVAFVEAKTPLAKAKVAARLLKKVVKTNGLCLDSQAGK